MTEDVPAAAAKPGLAGVIGRWLGAALLLGAVFCWLTGLQGAGLLAIGGGLLLATGMAFGVADRRNRPEGASAPPPSLMLAFVTAVMTITAFLLGAGRTMGSAPSSSNDFLIEGVALVATLLLFLLTVAAFVGPKVRRPAALISTATVAGLILFSSLMG